MTKSISISAATDTDGFPLVADSKVMRQLRSLHLVKNPVVLLDLRQNAKDLRARLQGDLASMESRKSSTGDRLMDMVLDREIPAIKAQIQSITDGLADIERRTEVIAGPKKPNRLNKGSDWGGGVSPPPFLPMTKYQASSGYKQPGEPLYTKAEAAAYLRVSQRTVDRQIARLDLLTYKVGNQVRIPESTLHKMLGKRTMTQAERNNLIQHKLYGDS